METIGKRIKRLRLDRGFTRQTEFAPMVGMTQSSLSDVESKNKEFSALQLLALCHVLKVSPEYLMNGGREDDMGLMELMRIYEALPEQEKAMLIRMASGLLPNTTRAKAA